MSDIEKLTGINLDKDIVEVEHKSLERSGKSHYRSKCPKCHSGTLLVGRDQKSFILSEYDRCILCGQSFRYLDIEELRKRERGK